MAAVLSEDGRACRSFLQLVLSAAASDESIGRHARSVRLPPDIACNAEYVLGRRGRGRVRRQSADLGRADLFFSGGGMRLVCELKLDAPYGKDQLQRYLESGHYVIAIVRSPGPVRSTVAESSRWLGEVSWGSIRDGLSRLPVRPAVEFEWQSLLRVMDTDGDFDPRPPTRTTERDLQLAEVATSEAVQRLGSRRMSADLRKLIRGFVITVSKRRRGAAALVSGGTNGDVFFTVTVSESSGPTPKVEIRWHPMPISPPFAGQRAMHALLTDDGFRAHKVRSGRYFSEAVTLRDAPGEGSIEEKIAEWLLDRMAAVVHVGLLNWDAENLKLGV
ncbi:hypothetical protein HJD18_12465 [Thermoleophilia bacterium SCSIO 60948]|nr:hypothetical protein HJD18_12465 [Thermoleophilia bacterium SCSIO 60948]